MNYIYSINQESIISGIASSVNTFTDIANGVTERVMPHLFQSLHGHSLTGLFWLSSKDSLKAAKWSVFASICIYAATHFKLSSGSTSEPLGKKIFKHLKLREFSGVSELLKKTMVERKNSWQKNWKALPEHEKMMNLMLLVISCLSLFNLSKNLQTRFGVLSVSSTALIGGVGTTTTGLYQIIQGIKSKQFNWKERTTHVISGTILTSVGVMAEMAELAYLRGFLA